MTGFVKEARGFVMGTSLSMARGLCETGGVKRFDQIRRLLAILVIVGLAIAPLAGRANAAGSTTMAAMSDHAAVSADMPCCPDKSSPGDCDQCPLMALCATTPLQAPLPAGMARILPVTLRMPLPASDPAAESLALLPPPKPPRLLARPA
ncbi:MAG: hypothetical protein PS018_29825 [bacterium]|nr:hypothetical protein [bacterium]